MQPVSTSIPYHKTGYFSSIVADYISGQPALQPFYHHPATIEGIKETIRGRQGFATDRALLVAALTEQYKEIVLTAKQQVNIELLNNSNSYTICTAHQPNIFTGHLYFIYKIVHTIKLAETFKKELPENDFVPVYYMGSEDADLEELGHIYVDGQKYEWQTSQTGAVGRMKVDKALLQLIDAVSGQLLGHEFGGFIIDLLKQCYQLGSSIEQSTFKLVNALFAEYGLLILLPDSRLLKRAFVPVVAKELTEGFSYKAVQETVTAFPAQYKVQAGGREINLFYLTDESRERIEWVNGEWSIVNTDKRFSTDELLAELEVFPERFSPNVILRPVFQEMILPNIAFIGGGGEIAYWLELKKVFAAAGVPYPVLVVRNSFLVIKEKQEAAIRKLNLDHGAIFRSEFELMNLLVQRDSNSQLSLDNEKEKLSTLYDEVAEAAGKIDITLQRHSAALKAKALQKIEVLEKKMLRAEKKKFEAQQHQLQVIKQELFPRNNLQERTENFMLLYAKWGSGFIQAIYQNSLSLEQEFVVLAHGN